MEMFETLLVPYVIDLVNLVSLSSVEKEEVDDVDKCVHECVHISIRLWIQCSQRAGIEETLRSDLWSSLRALIEASLREVEDEDELEQERQTKGRVREEGMVVEGGQEDADIE